MKRALLNYMTHNRNLHKPQLHFSNVALHYIFQNFPARAEPRPSLSCSGDPAMRVPTYVTYACPRLCASCIKPTKTKPNIESLFLAQTRHDLQYFVTS